MRLLFVADLHFALKQFDWLLAHAENYDVIVIGGDLLDLSSSLDLDVQITVVEKYLGLLRKSGKTLVVSSGNHDGDSRNAADESVAQWIQEARAPGVYVDGDGFDLADWRVTVCPWWDGELSRAALVRQLADEATKVKVPGRWIWIHHAPPAGARTCWTGRKWAGDEFLKRWIDQYQPAMVLSGHIHNAPFHEEGSWIDRIGRTWVFNPGKQVGPAPATLTIDLDALTAEWHSLSDRVVRQLNA